MSAFNAAMAYNLKDAIKSIYHWYTIDYEKALVSPGSLPRALNPHAMPGVARPIDFTWDDNSFDTNTSVDDKVVLVLYNPLRNQAITLSDGTRDSGMDSITLPDLFSGESVECYIFFTDDNESVVSDSKWVGRITIA